MAKDRVVPCEHYVCAGADCKKGFKGVTLSKCKSCKKYCPRKQSNRMESVKSKRQKDKARHDRDFYY